MLQSDKNLKHKQPKAKFIKSAICKDLAKKNNAEVTKIDSRSPCQRKAEEEAQANLNEDLVEQTEPINGSNKSNDELKKTEEDCVPNDNVKNEVLQESGTLEFVKENKEDGKEEVKADELGISLKSLLGELPDKPYIPPKNLKYYLYDEVCIHNKWNDFWIVIHGNVMDLSPMLKDRRDSWNKNLEYLTAFGGKDLSYLFHENGLPKTETSPVTGKPRLIFPPILEVALSSYCKTEGKIWSQDVFYHIGRVTRRARRLRIINTLTMTTQLMKVCDEDTIFDIQEKYKSLYNSHAGSYLWRKFSNGGKCDGKLRLSGTLDENGLDEPECEIELPPPSIWLYYTDDFTIA